MRLLIDTKDIKFRVKGVQERPDFRDKDSKNKRQATTQDGRLIWTVRLDAVDDKRETSETIFVEVAGDEPKLTFDSFAVVNELVYAPWVGRDGKIKRAFRAESVSSAAAQPVKTVHAA
jgi:hypothetical protein